MPAPYARVKCDSRALVYLGVVPADVADCLAQAFANMRKGKLKLENPRPWRDTKGPLYTRACGHLIFASEDPSGQILVVSEMLRDDDDDVI